MFARLFGPMDLYKVIILLSLVGAPVAGFFGWQMRKECERGRTAIERARGKGGELEQIGTLLQQLDNQTTRSTGQGSGANYAEYFVERVLTSATAGLRREDFIVGNRNEQRNNSAKAVDVSVDIEFKKGGKDRAPLQRDFIHAVLFNCEAKWTIWKLRELTLRQKDFQSAKGTQKAPPGELPDEWIVEKMSFACREPEKR